MPRLLLTRPRAASDRLAAKLTASGYAVLIEPLLTIQPLLTPLPLLADIDAVMITSANALDALAQTPIALPPELYRLPCFCVGQHTAALAGAAGFTDPRYDTNGAGDGLALAESILKTQARHILHLAGQNLASAGADRLRGNGRMVVEWVIYVAEPAAALSMAAQAALTQGSLDGVMVFSTRTATTLAELIQRQRLEACCPSLIALGLSTAVTQALRALPWRRLAAAVHPHEAALLDLVQEFLPVTPHD